LAKRYVLADESDETADRCRSFHCDWSNAAAAIDSALVFSAQHFIGNRSIAAMVEHH
jgi:hypothetical protein